jgi:hypothetical protein
MNDDFSVSRFVEDEIGIRPRRHSPNRGVVGHSASLRIPQQQIGHSANSNLDTRSALRGTINDVIQNRFKVSKGRKRIAQLHRPCLAHTARTCSSVANSPRSAAALERATTSRSSGERMTGARWSAPASCMMARAMSSWSSDGRRRTASIASSRSFVIVTIYGRDGSKSRTGSARLCDGHRRRTPDDIKEILLQQAIYCGVPAANHAVKEANAIIAEMGLLKS